MKIIKFNNFNNKINKINEVKVPQMKIDEILDDVTKVNNNTLKSVLVSYYKTYEDYIDLIDKNTHHFKIHDMTGDIMQNNRVSFDVYIFDRQDIKRISKNLVDISIGEFYSELPNNLNIFGIDLKPSSFINKQDLEVVFDEIYTEEETVNIITNILGFKEEGRFNDFYIWSNKQ